MLDAPVPLPRVFSPDNPFLLGRTPNLAGSNGFEAMALSADGKTLYPFLEGPLVGDDPLVRRVYEFDVKERRYTGRNWIYRMTQPGHVRLRRRRVRPRPADRHRARQQPGPGRGLEEGVRDRRAGPQAEPPSARSSTCSTSTTRTSISLFGARPGDFGLGNPFKFPYQTVEAVLPLDRQRAAFVNDTNFGSTGRNPNLPDYSDFIIVKVPGIRVVVPSVSWEAREASRRREGSRSARTFGGGRRVGDRGRVRAAVSGSAKGRPGEQIAELQAIKRELTPGGAQAGQPDGGRRCGRSRRSTTEVDIRCATRRPIWWSGCWRSGRTCATSRRAAERSARRCRRGAAHGRGLGRGRARSSRAAQAMTARIGGTPTHEGGAGAREAAQSRAAAVVLRGRSRARAPTPPARATQVTGVGTKLCALSDGVDSLAASQAAGELPAVDVLPDQAGDGDEGTAMLEILHDVAPGAELGFATAFTSDASFADNIRALRSEAGCDVIVDDVLYFNESPFQDGPIAQAVNDVTADGALYFSSAGNEGNTLDGTSGNYEGDFRGSGRGVGKFAGEAHDFDPGPAVQVFEPISPDSSAGVPVTLFWADPLGAAADDYDLYLFDAAGKVRRVLAGRAGRRRRPVRDPGHAGVGGAGCGSRSCASPARRATSSSSALRGRFRAPPTGCRLGDAGRDARALGGRRGVQRGRGAGRGAAAVRPRAGRSAEPGRAVPGRVHRRPAARALHLRRAAADVLPARRCARARSRTSRPPTA